MSQTEIPEAGAMNERRRLDRQPKAYGHDLSCDFRRICRDKAGRQDLQVERRLVREIRRRLDAILAEWIQIGLANMDAVHERRLKLAHLLEAFEECHCQGDSRDTAAMTQGGPMGSDDLFEVTE